MYTRLWTLRAVWTLFLPPKRHTKHHQRNSPGRCPRALGLVISSLHRNRRSTAEVSYGGPGPDDTHKKIFPQPESGNRLFACRAGCREDFDPPDLVEKEMVACRVGQLTLSRDPVTS